MHFDFLCRLPFPASSHLCSQISGAFALVMLRQSIIGMKCWTHRTALTRPVAVKQEIKHCPCAFQTQGIALICHALRALTAQSCKVLSEACTNVLREAINLCGPRLAVEFADRAMSADRNG